MPKGAGGTDDMFGSPGEDDPFWVNALAPAVLKHGILRRHLPVFTSKTGSRSQGGRVAFLDGYAGRGRYADGTPGSAEIALRVARQLGENRDLRCLFAEKDRANYDNLCSVAAEYDDVHHVERHGAVQEHLDELLGEAFGMPLMAFLDPYGLTLGPDVIAKRFFLDRSGIATDVLINLSCSAIYRGWGVLTSGKDNPGRERAVTNLNDAFGGTWWQNTYAALHESSERATMAVANEYTERLCTTIGGSGWTIPVRKNEHHQPIYCLVFLSRHPDGLHVMGENISLAQKEWRRQVVRGTLFDTDAYQAVVEKDISAAYSDNIRPRIVQLLEAHGEVDVAERYLDIFGPLAGQARMTHVNTARDQLKKAGYLTNTKTGRDGWDQKFTRTGAPAPS